MIDSVLVPAASADELPVAGAQPAPSPTVSEPQPPAGETVEGLASGAGYLANCTVSRGWGSAVTLVRARWDLREGRNYT